MTSYLRYGWLLLMSGPLTYVTLVAGGAWTWIGFLGPMAVMLTGDAVLPLDHDKPVHKHPHLLNVFLFAQVPLTLIAVVLIGWKVTPGDFGSIGMLVQDLTGVDVLTRRDVLPVFSIWGAILSTSLLISANFFIAHELIHRKGRLSRWSGMWLLAAVGDTQFVIAHLHQHHKHVGTPDDPATARRGESLYAFMLRSAWGQFISAWRIERERLTRIGKSPWTLSNRFLAGQMMTLLIVAAVGFGMGWQALLLFVACAAYSKALYEAVNYIQHYGLVRVPGTAVEPRHSWDCVARMSGSFLINLTRHADHHARGDAPFWDLAPMRHAPMHRLGYFATIFVAMMPSLWKRRMQPLLDDWDRHLATPAEAALSHTRSR